MSMRYVLLLRGVNVGGKNRVPMDGLKRQLSSLGFTNVQSYINSGNLIFDSELEEREIKYRLREMLAERYPFDIPFALVDAAAYTKAFEDLPGWWNGPLARRDLLFFTDEVDRDGMVKDIREMELHSEAVHFSDVAVFWGKFDEKEYLCTAYHRQLGSKVYYKQITIRNGNTAWKLLALLDK